MAPLACSPAECDQSWLEPTWVPSPGDLARTGEFQLEAVPEMQTGFPLPEPARPVEPATKSSSTPAGMALPPDQIVSDIEAANRPGSLLRTRLTSAAWVMLIGMGLLFGWQMVVAEPSPPWLRGGLLILLVGSVVLLTGARELAESQLRLIELALFGAVGVQLTASQLAWLTQAVVHQDAVGLIWIACTGTLAFAVLMLSYGMFMPNGWRRTALMLAPGAIVPIVTFEFLRWWSRFAAEILSPMLLWESAAILLAVLALAVYGTSTIALLRHEVRQARKFGQYRLKGRIGQGGMGQVYLAEHRLLKRPCAIKLIRPNQVNDSNSLIRFEREVRTTSRLSHWNTIEIYDYGRTDDGALYYVMEYLPGMNLGDLVRKYGPMCPARVIHFLKQTCSALEEAHAAGLIHRDLKPANIFASERGGVYDVTKLIDFGLVVDDVRTDLLQTTDVKRVGPFAGSPLYMAPEQA
ncbi:MAG: serine/threonine-protein kinase, partial [Planctomycetaceae bacterium]|nr:serine/threonine-protein kinase [Planctomycetaceae bacterium]